MRVVSDKDDNAKTIASYLVEDLNVNLKNKLVDVLGPAPAPVYKVNGRYRWQLMLKGKFDSEARSQIRNCISQYRKKASVIINLEVDPFGV